MRGSSRWSDVRERGGLWVAAQLVLMAGITAALLLPPEWPDSVRLPLRVVGILLLLVGLALVLWAYGALGRAFTLFPRPRGAVRVETGPYRFARHPMYGGGILLFSGLSLEFSVTALAVTAALAILWRGKSAVEESLLLARFPDYEAYRERTPRHFLPWVY
jgi:protein-S-isoprenylcysteine O-methyltransferase Ste14